MTSANRAGAERERYDPSTADDAYAARERRDAQSGAGFVDRGEHAFKEKESDYIQEFIPSSSHTPGSGQHIREELKYLTQEGLEPDVQTTTPKPTQAFTDESTAGQSQGRGLDPTEKLQGQESERVPEDKRSDQENPQPDRETFVTQRSCDYDPEDGMPAVVVTQPEEVSSDQAEDINLSVTLEDMMHSDFSRNASPSDGTELSGSDLLSLKSDTLSLLSEAAISCKSDEQEGPEEDTRSVTASSVMSLFHRVQMDPIEKEWLRCAALGNATTLYLLLKQDPTLVSKKTALHWAAKQGRAETADMMARSGADVNQRAGYTPLHLASLHGHDKIIQLLINNYNAKVNIRDYHGKMAAHYWSGSKDIFTEHRSHSAGSWPRGRRAQCYAQLSALLSRSQSNRNIGSETSSGPLELHPPHPDTHSSQTTAQ
ncbi:ankyrin repeat domain-containing protein SOWAHB isoform X2 [Puntigrus tetrazona]|uniref:ankyrin repeat domain-containing protein SOWAHB isoform X2 n=1 Tax=Puntigrus tetrazona TaxID=1606681 RepID=UPI001C88FDFC|nr:ankyrin repeat domain-containing protein SOWAHB isoform X2 [Puntigrus tetrazona]